MLKVEDIEKFINDYWELASKAEGEEATELDERSTPLFEYLDSKLFIEEESKEE